MPTDLNRPMLAVRLDTKMTVVRPKGKTGPPRW